MQLFPEKPMSNKEDVADLFFKNYDYTQEEANETSPGGGLYNGEIGKHKSVTEFLNKKRKKSKKPRHIESLLDMAEKFYKIVNS